MLRKIEEKIKNVLKPGEAYFLSVVSGCLLFSAFPPLNWFVVGWIALVPFIFALKGKSVKESFLLGFVFFAVFFSMHIFWLHRVTVPGMIVLVSVLSVFGGLFGIATRYVLSYSLDLLLLPFVWVILEYLRGRVLTGFPWGSLSLSQWNNLKMIQIADLTGAWGVSFLMVMTSCALFAILSRSKKAVSYFAVCIFFLAVSYSYGTWRIDNKEFFMEKGPEVRLVQGNIPQHVKWDDVYAEEIIKKHVELSYPEKTLSSPDLVIWPETAYPYLVDGPSLGHLSAIAKKIGAGFMTGAVFEQDSYHHNSALQFSSDGEFERVYHKLHLVPFGEYVPLEDKIGFLRDYIDKPMGDFKAGEDYTIFDLRTQSKHSHGASGALVREVNFYKFAVLICIEDIFPYIGRTFRKKGADFLVNITNDAWFGRSAAAWQHLSSSVLRAVENRTSVVRAANTGISAFIDPMGEIHSILIRDGEAIFVEGAIQDRVRISRTGSFYSEYGEVFVLFCLVMILLTLAVESKKLRKT